MDTTLLTREEGVLPVFVYGIIVLLTISSVDIAYVIKKRKKNVRSRERTQGSNNPYRTNRNSWIIDT